MYVVVVFIFFLPLQEILWEQNEKGQYKSWHVKASSVYVKECVPIDDSDSEDTPDNTDNHPPVAALNNGTGVKRPFAEDECITLDSDSDEEETETKRACMEPNRPGTPDSDIIILDEDFD